MTMPGTEVMQRSLIDWSRCPRCGWHPVENGGCPRCRADLSGQVAREIANASMTAARVLAHRDMLIARLPVLGKDPVGSPAATPTPVPPRARATAAPAVSDPGVSVQSVLAVAGAALVAVAAIVFTFLNPDLTDFATRTTVIAVVTLAFLAGASLLSRSALRVSAETVSALAVVLVGLDVWALAQTASSTAASFVLAAIGVFIAGAVLLVLAIALRVRVWSLAGLSGLAIVPAFIGYAVGTPLAAVLGHLAVGFTTLAVSAAARRLRPRFGAALAVELWTSSALRVIVVLIILGQLVAIDLGDVSSRTLGTSALLVGVATIAAFSARHGAASVWSFVAGVLIATAVAIVPFASGSTGELRLVAVPLAAAVALCAVASIGARVSRATGIRPTSLAGGAVTVLLATSVPAVVVAVAQFVSKFSLSNGSSSIVPPALGLASIGALAAVSGAIAVLTARSGASGVPTVRRGRAVALSFAMVALVTLVGWSGFVPTAQIAIGLTSAVALGVASSRVSPALRIVMLATAHTLLALVAGLVFTPEPIGLVGAALVLAAVALVARNVASRVRAVHAAIGFGYALAIIGASMSPVIPDRIALMCLVTTVAAIVALAVTLSSRLTSRVWYAVLGVTAVPFLIGVVSVLLVRSGWTALSTALIFALALTLVLTRRDGMTRWLRAAAAALLVPSLAVVVVCLGAQLLAVSGSPVVLPVVAAIVAGSLTTVSLLSSALVRAGIPTGDVRWVRWAIEGTALVTGALAVLLALVRAAAGLPTSILVLVILAIGGALAARVAGMPYGWPVAGVSATGALWCALAMWGADVAELYLLPPAVALIVVGATSTAHARTRSGPAFVIAGLALSLTPTLILLGTPGGPDAAAGWRTAGLLSAAVGLSVVASIGVRRSIHSLLSRATAISAIVAAAGGSLGGLRLAQLPVSDDVGLVMLPVLALAGVATILAVAGGRVLVSTFSGERETLAQRIPFMPAVVYLVAGPISAIRPGWLPILSLLALSVVLLIAMIVTVNRARTRPVHAPPVWFLFGLAWITAVAGWSERELRVESFSLPLGAALLAVGVLASRNRRSGIRPTWTSWPLGFTGSWKLLGPGLLVTLLPSILATATDPLTWRAILVIAIALAAVLAGSLRRLGAPFILGIVVLPIENAVVFAVQIGRSISAAPWWITLATAGAALLVIAVTYERRGRQARGVGIRELG